MFSDVVIVLRESTIQDTIFIQHAVFNNIVRGMYEVKPFHLVFSLETWEGDKEDTVKALRRCVDVETAKGRLDFLPRPPVIVFNPRAARSPKRNMSRAW